MRKLVLFTVAFVLVGGGAASVGALGLQGADEATTMTRSVLSACPGTSAIQFVGGSSDTGEQAMLTGTEQVAPMTRFLGSTRTCASAHPERSEGRLVAHAAESVVADAESASQCGSSLSANRAIAVTERNGKAGLQCPGCSGATYTLTDWRDALRVLFTGMHHDAGSDLALRDCSSDVRYALVKTWANSFAGTCGAGACTEVRHLFRPSDLSEATDAFLGFLNVPGTASTPAPFCNGTDLQDVDPIRVSCTPTTNDLTADIDDACEADGHLGLLLPVTQAENALGTVQFNVDDCQDGKFAYFPMSLDVPTGCPDGTPRGANKCLWPVTSQGKPCLARYFNTNPFFHGTDPRAFNLTLRFPTGALVQDAAGRDMYSVFYRIHSSHVVPATATNPAGAACRQTTSPAQAACLTQASPCSLALSNFGGLNVPGVSGLAVNGVGATVGNVRKLQQQPVPPDVYPLARNVYFNTMTGSGHISDAPQSSLFGCFSNRSVVDNAATVAGFVTIGADPPCIDFDERQCGAGLNNDNCQKPVDLCPQVATYTVTPLQQTVGGTIAVSVVGFDSDDPPSALQYLWTADAGTFANPTSDTTTYTCTAPGNHVLSAQVWDGSCGDAVQIPITCIP